MYLTESAVDIDALKKRILDGLRAGRFGSAGDLVDVSDGVSLLIGVSLEEVKAI